MPPDPKHRKAGAPPKNRNAAKGENNLSATLQIRCTPAEKRAWERAATMAKRDLSPWVRDTLNNPRR